ncbi:MAG: adenosylcobinamide-GDP ribazoletransferase [Desulfurococcales archaeon]|nr:adenosylcobinamide-GDP ribazoletransferase [Desulfurococcales archaeon]
MSLKGFASLLSFLTIIPTKRHDIEEASRSFYLVPLIGLITGTFTILPLTFINKLTLASIVATLVTYVITGFIHLDGLADFIDALASGKKGASAVKIMKEPWRGTYAIVSVSLCILITYASILELHSSLLSILISYIMIYESMYILAALSPRPQHEGLGRIFINNAKKVHTVLKNIVTLVITLVGTTTIFYLVASSINVVTFLKLNLLLFTTSLTTPLVTLKIARRVTGYASGDVLGFNLEICRSLTLLLMALLVT